MCNVFAIALDGLHLAVLVVQGESLVVVCLFEFWRGLPWMRAINEGC